MCGITLKTRTTGTQCELKTHQNMHEHQQYLDCPFSSCDIKVYIIHPNSYSLPTTFYNHIKDDHGIDATVTDLVFSCKLCNSDIIGTHKGNIKNTVGWRTQMENHLAISCSRSSNEKGKPINDFGTKWKLYFERKSISLNVNFDFTKLEKDEINEADSSLKRSETPKNSVQSIESKHMMYLDIVHKFPL